MEQEVLWQTEEQRHAGVSEAQLGEPPAILADLTIEELAVDGICGIY